MQKHPLNENNSQLIFLHTLQNTTKIYKILQKFLYFPYAIFIKHQDFNKTEKVLIENDLQLDLTF